MKSRAILTSLSIEMASPARSGAGTFFYPIHMFVMELLDIFIVLGIYLKYETNGNY